MGDHKDETNASAPTADMVVAIAASAGGLKALTVLLSALPVALPAAVVVVQHLAPDHISYMAKILGERIALPVHQARDGERLRPGIVYVAPPDYHVLLRRNGAITLSHTAQVHFVRPSADVLFESVAANWGPRCIAVVLTGAGSDGARGIQAVKRAGGTVIAQDEATSEFFGMPGAAIQTGSVDLILPLDEIAGALVALLTPGAIR
jgi:two-component system chemotaxis response regulator CheB